MCHVFWPKIDHVEKFCKGNWDWIPISPLFHHYFIPTIRHLIQVQFLGILATRHLTRHTWSGPSSIEFFAQNWYPWGSKRLAFGVVENHFEGIVGDELSPLVGWCCIRTCTPGCRWGISDYHALAYKDLASGGSNDTYNWWDQLLGSTFSNMTDITKNDER